MTHSPKSNETVKPFVKFPVALLQSGISCRAKLLYAMLKSHEPNGGGKSWPSRRRLAGFLGWGVNRVAPHVKELVAAGWLKCEGRPGSTCHYTTLTPTRNSVATNELPPPETVQHSHPKQGNTPTRNRVTGTRPKNYIKELHGIPSTESIADLLPEATKKITPKSLGFTWNTNWKKPKDCSAKQLRAVLTVAEAWSVRITRIRVLNGHCAGRIFRRLTEGYSAGDLMRAVGQYAGTEWIIKGGTPKNMGGFFQPEYIDRELARRNGEATIAGHPFLDMLAKRGFEVHQRKGDLMAVAGAIEQGTMEGWQAQQAANDTKGNVGKFLERCDKMMGMEATD